MKFVGNLLGNGENPWDYHDNINRDLAVYINRKLWYNILDSNYEVDWQSFYDYGWNFGKNMKNLKKNSFILRRKKYVELYSYKFFLRRLSFWFIKIKNYIISLFLIILKINIIFLKNNEKLNKKLIKNFKFLVKWEQFMIKKKLK